LYNRIKIIANVPFLRSALTHEAETLVELNNDSVIRFTSRTDASWLKCALKNGCIRYFRYAGNSSLCNSFVVTRNSAFIAHAFPRGSKRDDDRIPRRGIPPVTEKLSTISLRSRPCPFLRLSSAIALNPTSSRDWRGKSLQKRSLHPSTKADARKENGALDYFVKRLISEIIATLRFNWNHLIPSTLML